MSAFADSPPLGSSFRDPSGYVFLKDSMVYRRINEAYLPTFNTLQKSGFYQKLQDSSLYIGHEIVESTPSYTIIRPQQLPFISYPYEWCFSQLKEAALCTLEIQRVAVDSGLTLKDASAFNIQFVHGKAQLIDSLSFAVRDKNMPWVAYHQFCKHFLAPLALMAYSDPGLNGLFINNIDGIPLPLAVSLLPARAFLRPGILIHLYIHGRLGSRYAKQERKAPDRTSFSKNALYGLIESLRSAICSCRLPSKKSFWARYYTTEVDTETYLQAKKELVSGVLSRIQPDMVWDLGANTGEFARLAAQQGSSVVAMESDPLCVELCYGTHVKNGVAGVLPLRIDMANPSPSIGWDGEERLSLLRRGPADLLLALALVHHLAIGNNVPLRMIADSFAKLGRWLIVEFVPPEDHQVKRMLSLRDNVFELYTQVQFEKSFSELFTIHETHIIPGSQRVLYVMKRHET